MLFPLGPFGVVPLILPALWIYCILDVIATDDALVRNLSKGIRLLIVIFLPDIGSLAWLLLGRPMYAGWRPGDTSRPRRSGSSAPRTVPTSPPARAGNRQPDRSSRARTN